MKTIKYTILIITIILSMARCMDIQDSYDFKSTPVSNEINMTTWEFIESRQDIFSQLKRAIIHADLQDLYSQTDKKYTYLLLQNAAFNDPSAGIITSIPGASTIEDIDKEVLKNILLYHTVDGYYHGLGTLSFDPIFVITLWKSPEAIMTLKLSNSTDRDTYSRLQANDLAGKSTVVIAETSNIFPTNGIIHVFKRPIVYKP